MDQKNDVEKFKILLNCQYKWPCCYTFKFIVTPDRINEVKDFFKKGDDEIDLKYSKNKKYVSITVKSFKHSSDEVIETYRKLKSIPGLISL